MPKNNCYPNQKQILHSSNNQFFLSWLLRYLILIVFLFFALSFSVFYILCKKHQFLFTRFRATQINSYLAQCHTYTDTFLRIVPHANTLLHFVHSPPFWVPVCDCDFVAFSLFSNNSLVRRSSLIRREKKAKIVRAESQKKTTNLEVERGRVERKNSVEEWSGVEEKVKKRNRIEESGEAELKNRV